MNYYNQLLKEVREDKDILQKQAAFALGTTQQQIFKYESGQQEMTVSKLKILCEFYDVSADYILGLNYGMPWPRKERIKLMQTDKIVNKLCDDFIEMVIWAIDEQSFNGDELKHVMIQNIEKEREDTLKNL